MRHTFFGPCPTHAGAHSRTRADKVWVKIGGDVSRAKVTHKNRPMRHLLPEMRDAGEASFAPILSFPRMANLWPVRWCIVLYPT